MGKFFTVDVVPDCIAGDVSDNDGSTDVGAGDIVFDWTAINVPKGSCCLRSISAYVNAEDGALGSGSLTDLELVFAKSVDNVAPPSLGEINGAQSACGELRHHYVGGARLESVAATGTLSKLTFGVGYIAGTMANDSGGKGGQGLPLVIDLEPVSSNNAGYDTLYVAGFQVGDRNYGTATTANIQFTDATCDYNDDPTITMDSTASIKAGMTVTGTGIPAGATVSSVTNATTFELSAATTGGAVTNGTLTFESIYDASARFAAGTTKNSIVVTGTDARKIFSPGDQVYVYDVDTPIPGTLTKVTDTTLTFSETNGTVDIAHTDELLNANPWRIKLGFER
tara:strand:- start:296 stop:1312 length:1017 start_codon:yes stop_codon:yes gene_type:complete